jgi:hypothetical protein
MRVELAEKERLDAARQFARETFQRYLGHLSRTERADYWGRIEVLYQPYFAYEEVLATFAERRRQTNSLLASMEALAGVITRGSVTELKMSEQQRLEGLKRFDRPRPTPSRPGTAESRAYISYSHEDRDHARQLVEALESRQVDVWWDQELRPGDEWEAELAAALSSSGVIIALIGKHPLSSLRENEISHAMSLKKRVIPVLVGGADRLPGILQRFHAAEIGPVEPRRAIEKLADDVKSLIRQEAKRAAPPTDPDDPQKGRWGGLAISNGRELTATVREVSDRWFKIALEVHSTTGPLLDGTVEFHLHPTFRNQVKTVEAVEGRAVLRLSAWGAFTVGAVADDGKTMLELDLSADPSYPSRFRLR